MWKYSDPITGDLRYKRRYVWAVQAFVAGTFFGMLLMYVI
jgi:hypothetical protein